MKTVNTNSILRNISNNLSETFFIILTTLTLLSNINFAQGNVIFSQDWESGQGTWYADNGLWEWGSPVVGPTSAHSGQYLVGTILNGNYSSNASTRLISPSITLPSIQEGEAIYLYFWQWFKINNIAQWGVDNGFIQISVNGGDWETISNQITGSSPVWSQMGINLSSYADSTIRIAFYFTSSYTAEDNGWYIDDISIEKGVFTFTNPEDFELGFDNWYADNGLWEVGVPSVGPTSTHSGQNCAGTVLNGNYQSYADTRFISPSITLKPQSGQSPILCYWQWFKINNISQWGVDEGNIQISVNGGDWQTISGPITGGSPNWTQNCIDLSSYSDSTVRIAFYFTSSYTAEDNGWYIDDVRIEGIEVIPVELISFTANMVENKVRLEWSTATETNNRGFEIEQSSDKSNFTKIGFVEGHGTTTEIHEYSFITKPAYAGLNYYRLKQIDYDGTFSYSKVIEAEFDIPDKYSLSQNYPNPFNPTTKITYTIPKEGKVSVKIFDMIGREVATLVNEEKPVGNYEVTFDATVLPSGVYFYQLKAEKFIETKKLILLK